MEEKNNTVYRTHERKDFGKIVSIDITPKLIKEFLQAQMYVDMGPVTGDSGEEVKKWAEKVRPFFQHFEEVLDNI